MIIAVVGIGLDGQDGLTRDAEEIVQQATFLAGSKRHLSYFPDHPAEKLNLVNLTTGIDAIAKANLANHSVVILVSGDPLFFGFGRLLLEHFKPSQLQFYPHFSSIQLAFSRLKIPWQDAQLISVHGRSTDRLVRLFKQGKEKIAVLTDNNNYPGAIARWFNFWTPFGGDPVVIDDKLADSLVKDANSDRYQDVMVLRLPFVNRGHERPAWFRRLDFVRQFANKLKHNLYWTP